MTPGDRRRPLLTTHEFGRDRREADEDRYRWRPRGGLPLFVRLFVCAIAGLALVGWSMQSVAVPPVGESRPRTEGEIELRAITGGSASEIHAAPTRPAQMQLASKPRRRVRARAVSAAVTRSQAPRPRHPGEFGR